MDFLRAIGITFSLFTTLPVPSRIEWTRERMGPVPFFIPLVGLVIGGLSLLVFHLLSLSSLQLFTKSVLMACFFAVVTGGFHLDALLDSADGYFSRRPIPRRLEIMTDSNVGAFAVISFGFFLLLRVALFLELFTKEPSLLLIGFIPLLSRFFQSSMLLHTPYAKDEGLAKMYGHQQKKHPFYYGLGLVIFIGIGVLWLPTLLVFLGGLSLFYLWWKSFTKRNFGGITGDLLGAFLELSELLLYALLVWRM